MTASHAYCSCPACVPDKPRFAYPLPEMVALHFDHEFSRDVTAEHAAPYEPDWERLTDRATD